MMRFMWFWRNRRDHKKKGDRSHGRPFLMLDA